MDARKVDLLVSNSLSVIEKNCEDLSPIQLGLLKKLLTLSERKEGLFSTTPPIMASCLINQSVQHSWAFHGLGNCPLMSIKTALGQNVGKEVYTHWMTSS